MFPYFNKMWDLFFRVFYIIIIAVSGVLCNRRNEIVASTSTTANPVSDFLSKFHQNDYKLIFERSELIRSNASFGDIQIRTNKFNRTTAVANINLTLKIDLGYETEIIAQAYRFASNEYREFPIRCQFNLCAAIASKTLGLDTISKENGNVVCPLVKGKKYYVVNFTPDESKFPPFIPSGKYMLELQFMYRSMEGFLDRNYGTIDRPIWVGS